MTSYPGGSTRSQPQPLLPLFLALRDHQMTLLEPCRAAAREAGRTDASLSREETRVLRNACSLEVWNEDAVMAIRQNLLLRIVRERGGFPWRSRAGGSGDWQEEAVSDLLEEIRCSANWHGYLAEAENSQQVDEVLIRRMVKWLRYRRDDIGTRIAQKRKRIVDASVDDWEDGEDDAGNRRRVVRAMAETAGTWMDLDEAYFTPLFIRRLTELDRGKAVPEAGGELPEGRHARLFFEFLLWQWQLLDADRLPPELRGVEQWTQQAWASWRGLPNSTANDAMKRVIEQLKAFQEQPADSDDALTLEETDAWMGCLRVKYRSWKPEFVLW